MNYIRGITTTEICPKCGEGLVSLGKGCCHECLIKSFLSEPTQVFFYSPVKYIKQGLERMMVGVSATKLTLDHLPLPPRGRPDPVLSRYWDKSISRLGRNEFITWAVKARKEGFWKDVDMRPVQKE